ncbi:MAG: tRNA pseudouridine(13) synthase TruD [Patescibacteria group bacterium]|nr:tRNA pseudouridine(13) synthase TruD [Patescibacteria group bacterium]
MSENISHELWENERATIDQLRRDKPEWFEIDSKLNPQRILKHIGIDTLPADRPLGYYRLYPQDFIVEEVAINGNLITITPEPPTPPQNIPDQRTLFCTLVKAGIFTLEALKRLSESLKIELKQIGYAGIKDAVAVTSQQISLRRIKYEVVAEHKIPGLFLKNYHYGKGVITVGGLAGNRFIIFIRTKEPVDPEWLTRHLTECQENGVLNYYGVQRFGSRSSVHQFGRAILQGNYTDALNLFLVGTNESEPPYFQVVRQKAQTLFDDGQSMLKEFQRFPYTFRNEIKVLEYLKENPNDILGALTCISEHTRLWVYAYVSYLFNKIVSEAAKKGKPLPETLPLLLSPDPTDHEPYLTYLKEDETESFLRYIKPFPFIRPAKRAVSTIIKPDIHASQITPEGVVISFTLPKGAYATTFLMNFFELTSGLIVPSWVKTIERDILKLVNHGSIEPVKKILGNYMLSRLDLGGSATETIAAEE